MTHGHSCRHDHEIWADLPAATAGSAETASASALKLSYVYKEEDMKVFDDQANVIEVGQKAADFQIDDSRRLSDLEGCPLFFVFWKTL